MLNSLAPIGISTYCRLQHLQQAISTLQSNDLARESELFVFSDAAKKGDEKKVASVRRYLRTVDGFKAVHVIEREENSRIANNRGGMRALLEKYGRVIFLEEDIVTAPGFLRFMNLALDKYENNDEIFSITGFCPPIPIPEDYVSDVFLLKRFYSWGFGIWKDRAERVNYVTPDEYERFYSRKDLVRLFADGGGRDMVSMLRADAHGRIDAFDVKAMYAQFLSKQYTVFPSKSLTSNIGLDGTGLHCGVTTQYNVTLSSKKTFDLPDNLVADKRIVKVNYSLMNRIIFARRFRRIIDRIKSHIGYPA